jgi:hypothetical protein
MGLAHSIRRTADSLRQVTLNGQVLAQVSSLSNWENASSGWYYAGKALIMVKTGRMPVGEEKVHTFR